eukprot:CFRG1445T1
MARDDSIKAEALQALDSIDTIVKNLVAAHTTDKTVGQFDRDALCLCDELFTILNNGVASGYFHLVSSAWRFIQALSDNQTILIVNGMPGAEDEIDKCRAWLRLSLNECTFIGFMETVKSNIGDVKKHYTNTAYLNKPAFLDRLIQILHKISHLHFNFYPTQALMQTDIPKAKIKYNRKSAQTSNTLSSTTKNPFFPPSTSWNNTLDDDVVSVRSASSRHRSLKSARSRQKQVSPSSIGRPSGHRVGSPSSTVLTSIPSLGNDSVADLKMLSISPECTRTNEVTQFRNGIGDTINENYDQLVRRMVKRESSSAVLAMAAIKVTAQPHASPPSCVSPTPFAELSSRIEYNASIPIPEPTRTPTSSLQNSAQDGCSNSTTGFGVEAVSVKSARDETNEADTMSFTNNVVQSFGNIENPKTAPAEPRPMRMGVVVDGDGDRDVNGNGNGNLDICANGNADVDADVNGNGNGNLDICANGNADVDADADVDECEVGCVKSASLALLESSLNPRQNMSKPTQSVMSLYISITQDDACIVCLQNILTSPTLIAAILSKNSQANILDGAMNNTASTDMQTPTSQKSLGNLVNKCRSGKESNIASSASRRLSTRSNSGASDDNKSVSRRQSAHLTQGNVRNKNGSNFTHSDNLTSSIVPPSVLHEGQTTPSKRTGEFVEAYATTIAPERGLPHQDYACADPDCDRALGPGTVNEPHVCRLTGLYFCIECMSTDRHVIPARVLLNWDCKTYPVASYVVSELSFFRELPIVDLTVVNPHLLSHVPELRRAERMREKLCMVVEFVLTCRRENVSALLEKVGPLRQHLIDPLHLYSLNDLVLASQLRLDTILQDLFNWCEKHVMGCTLCSQKGSYCEFCHSDGIMYPFHISKTVSCPECHSLAHAACFVTKPCPKCLRIAKVAEQKAKREARAKARAESLKVSLIESH